MSAITIDLLHHLRESGMKDEDARRIARSFDQRVEDALREAKAHSDRNRAESEEKAKTQFVSAADYHERDKTLATREDLHAEISGVRAEMAEIRKENRHTQRLILGGFITVTVAIIGGFSALIAKLYFGS